MAGKYARDNRGRFAPKGAGATARGGRLKTAAGNKRETQKIAALSGDRMSSVPKGTVGKTRKQREITMIDRPQSQRAGYNAGRAKQQGLIAARKATSSSTGSPRFEAVPQGAGRRSAALSGGRRINIHDNKKAGFTAALIGKDGAPRMERSGLRNVSAAKAWAANPNARGPRLMGGGLKTEASPKATWTRNAKPANTLGNKTGQSKTLNKFNSRPERTRGAYVGGRYVDKAKLTGRQPLDLGRGDDRAFGRIATKAARSRAATAAKPSTKPASKPQVSKAEKAVAAAQRRLRTKQYGSTANQAQGLLVDRRIASMSPRQYAASQVRSTSSLARRTSRALRSPINASAPRSWRDSMTRTLADQKKAFKAAASDYRILSPKKRRKSS